jgi:hypothetical protein
MMGKLIPCEGLQPVIICESTWLLAAIVPQEKQFG